MSSQQSQRSIWEVIDVPLPVLSYDCTSAGGPGKGSTTWAAHSHTPVALEEWTEFQQLVVAEGARERNLCPPPDQSLDLRREMETDIRRKAPVSSEEHVTMRLESLLGIFSSEGLCGDVQFPQRTQELIAAPDIVAMGRDDEALPVAGEYKAPEPGTRATTRRESVNTVRSLYKFPFETKPVWKFGFLKGEHAHHAILNEWEVPNDFTPDKMQAKVSLPDDWSSQKKKVFHVVRQLYGHMVADDRRYGILHIYENFFFCMRTDSGTLKIAPPISRLDTSPSVLHGIKTMVFFHDHEMNKRTLHPKSATKAAKKQRTTRDSNPPGPHPPPKSFNTSTQGTQVRSHALKGPNRINLASVINPWDCEVFDVTSNILLLTTTEYPSVILKLQQNAEKRHVEEEMAHEATVYAALEGNEAVQDATVPFFGHNSTRFGVAMTCLGREGDDLDDLGVENVSNELKQSALRAVGLLSRAGVLHNDLELRNMVQCRDNPNRAKIIDLGRAVFSSNEVLLAGQEERAKILLGLSGLTSKPKTDE